MTASPRPAIGYGPAFQGLRAAWRVGEDLFAEVALDGSKQARRRASSFTRRCSTRRCTLWLLNALQSRRQAEARECPSPSAACTSTATAPPRCACASRQRSGGQGLLALDADGLAGHSDRSLKTRALDQGALGPGTLSHDALYELDSPSSSARPRGLDARGRVARSARGHAGLGLGAPAPPGPGGAAGRDRGRACPEARARQGSGDDRAGCRRRARTRASTRSRRARSRCSRPSSPQSRSRRQSSC